MAEYFIPDLPSNSWTFGSTLWDPRVPCWKWIRCINSTSWQFSYFIPEQPLRRQRLLLSYSIQDQSFMAEYSLLFLNQQLNIYYVYCEHITLRHLATVILSLLNNYFFLPARLTSINVPFNLAALNLLKSFSISWFWHIYFTFNITRS